MDPIQAEYEDSLRTLGRKASRHLMRADELLEKSVSKASAARLPALYRRRDAILQKMKYGGLVDAAAIARWRSEHQSAGDRALDDDEVTKRLRADLADEGANLAKEINVAETAHEFEQRLAAEHVARAERRRSLTDSDVEKLQKEIADADAFVARVEQRAVDFGDRYPTGSATDNGIERRRGEIAVDHTQATTRATEARKQAAYYGVGAAES